MTSDSWKPVPYLNGYTFTNDITADKQIVSHLHVMADLQCQEGQQQLYVLVEMVKTGTIVCSL